jgi:HlyD family secretion protein
VSEADIGGVAEGQPVEFTVDAFPTRRFAGLVEQVRNAPTTNQNVITYTTVISVSNPDHKLKPGMTANVSITLAAADNILKIPNAAFRYRPADPAATPGATATRSQTGANSGPAVSPAEGAIVVASGQPQQGQVRAGSMPGGPRVSSGGRGPNTPNDTGDERSVYVLPGPGADQDLNGSAPREVRIRVGITDGAFTEVREGLRDGDLVVVGAMTGGASAPPVARDNPFAPPRPPRR